MNPPPTPGQKPWNRDRELPPEPLTTDEARGPIKAPSRRAPTGIRNRALLTILYRGGLRISEALALFPKDLNSDRGTVRVLHGKGDRARTVGLDPLAWSLIDRWLDHRKKLGIDARHPVFCTLQGCRCRPGTYAR